MALSGNISQSACRLVLCWAASVFYSILVMRLAARLYILVFGLSLVVPLVRFFLLSMDEVHRNVSEIVDSVRSMLRIGPLSPLVHMPPAPWELMFETKIYRYSSSRSHKATTSQDLFMLSTSCHWLSACSILILPWQSDSSALSQCRTAINELVRFYWTRSLVKL